MLSEQLGRTTIVASDGERDRAPVGIAYCHNVMPAKEGMDSVGYRKAVDPAVGLGAERKFVDVRVVFGSDRNRLYLGWDDLGNVFSLLTGATDWIAIPPTVPPTGGAGFNPNSVTVATVNGVSYIMYSGIAAFTYNEGLNALEEAVLAGLAIADVLGLVASSGYLIAYTDEAIAWSSTIDPVDFVPSQVTGAGGGNIAGIAGAVLFSVPSPTGVLIYTAANVIGATFTGNSSYPFKFREVSNSKGGVSLSRVAYEANSRVQYAYTKAGIQAINSQEATTILPEVTDFLAGRRFEDFNETTLSYEVTDIDPATTLLKKVKFIASRYLVVSYGITEYTHALVFDTALQRLGKLRITHADVFELVSTQSEIARESLAFTLDSGEVQVVDFSTQAASSGLLILGKVQFSSTRMTKLLGVEVENVETAATLDLYSQVSINGKTFATVQGTVREDVSNMREYAFTAVGKNHSIVFKGKFNLVTALTRFTLAGRR